MFYDLKTMMINELQLLDYSINKLKDALTDQTETRLSYRVTTNGKMYYERTRDSTSGKRVIKQIGDARHPDVIKIKQEKYNQKLLEVLETEKKTIIEAIKCIEKNSVNDIDAALPEVYRDDTGLVNKNTVFMTYDDWMKKPFRRNGYKIPEKSNIAVDGTKVRSKSEVIIYDLLTFLGIPFKYDVDVNLRNENNEKVYKNVDFVIPSANGSNILIEHLGMLSKEDYLENSFHKIRLYIMNGYALNETLFLTADDVYGNINAYTSKILFENLIIPQLRMRHTTKQD